MKLAPVHARLLAPLVLGLALAASSCIAHRQHRTSYELCTADGTDVCARSALHVHGEDEPFLGLIELDDQGALWDREQAKRVLDHLLDDIALHDHLIVVFVHGWKHSAADGDSNIAMLERNLEVLAHVEGELAARSEIEPRRVAGIYLGWRGGSVSLPWVKELTFWDRKSTAHRVGHGGITEVLARIEQIRDLRATLVEESRTRLVVVGHSFGGAVVYSALGQILEERFVAPEPGRGAVGAARGFGDLVVLLNPAFEAQRYAALSDKAAERHPYFPGQLPVLAILTSEGDDATGKAFPIGRFFSTLFEKERTVERANGFTREVERIDQGSASLRTVGHFEPYRTHDLRPAETPELGDGGSLNAFLAVAQRWDEDLTAGVVRFPGTELERKATVSPRNPYLVVRVDSDIIPNHNDIDDERVVQFLAHLILLSSQAEDPERRAEVRALGRKEAAPTPR